MSKSNTAPIIRRKKIIKADGHHGGAWKIAYADFVTAMMAFFLLMWLLNAASEDMKQGLADYFNPKITLKNDDTGGEGHFQGDSFTAVQKMPHSEDGPPEDAAIEENQAPPAEHIEALAASVESNFAEGAIHEELTQHLAVRMSDEGVVISLFDTDDASLFGNGSARPNAKMKRLLTVVSTILTKFENPIAIAGHTSSLRFATSEYNNWDLSIDRAQAIRQFFAAQQFPADRLSRVTGKADREHAVDDPMAAENRRIDITLLVDTRKSQER